MKPEVTEAWLGQTPEAWIGAEGTVGLGPTQTARLRRRHRAARPPSVVFLGAAFLAGLAVGALLCRLVTARRPRDRQSEG